MLRTKCSHFSPFRCRSGFCSGTFDPEVVRTHYEKNGTAFGVSPPRGVQSQPFRMILPPPNVTGNLHIGHAITVAIEDAFVRHHKACGKNVTWYPGFDHAGIATQSVVEKKLFRETGKYRRDLSDEEFVRYCEAWKNDRIAEISMQLKQLGADLDWSKMFYTMDELNFKYSKFD